MNPDYQELEVNFAILTFLVWIIRIVRIDLLRHSMYFSIASILCIKFCVYEYLWGKWIKWNWWDFGIRTKRVRKWTIFCSFSLYLKFYYSILGRCVFDFNWLISDWVWRNQWKFDKKWWINILVFNKANDMVDSRHLLCNILRY